MKCRRAEHLLSKALDEKLSTEEQTALDLHLENCESCRKAQAEYSLLRSSLGRMAKAEPLPFFDQRMEARIGERESAAPVFGWKRWGVAALSLSMLCIGLLIGSLFFYAPAATETLELSRSEELLLRELNPFQDTRTLFEAASAEQKNLMLIFSSLEETNVRRYFP